MKVPYIHRICDLQSRLSARITCIPPCPDDSYFVLFVLLVVEYLLFVFCQESPLYKAAMYGHEAVVSYLKRAADPNMLEVSM